MGKSCGKILFEILVGKSCGKSLRENLVGKSSRKFSIWNRVMGSQPIRIQLRKILWENLAGNAVGNVVGNVAEKF